MHLTIKAGLPQTAPTSTTSTSPPCRCTLAPAPRAVIIEMQEFTSEPTLATTCGSCALDAAGRRPYAGVTTTIDAIRAPSIIRAS